MVIVYMVRVITIRDDVYAELYQLKRAKGMSFSLAIEYLLKEKQGKNKGLMPLAGSLAIEDVDDKALTKIIKGMDNLRK